MRDRVELSVDGGVQNGEQALKLALLGADRIGFGTTVLMSIGCSMLRQCHLAGPQPGDTTGTRRLGCTPGVATQDPRPRRALHGPEPQHHDLPAPRGRGDPRSCWPRWACAGSRTWSAGATCSRAKPDLAGKAALVDVGHLVSAPPAARARARDLAQPDASSTPAAPRVREDGGGASGPSPARSVEVQKRLTNIDRCVGRGRRGPGRAPLRRRRPARGPARDAPQGRGRATSTPPTASPGWSSTCRGSWPTPPSPRPTAARS